jgi:hypothetical protein
MAFPIYKLYNYTFSSKRKMATQAFIGITQAPVQTVTDITSYFFRKGKKSSIEKNTFLIFKNYALRKNKGKESNIAEPTMFDFFESFFISATPFIGLKTRRKHRGNLVINKVVALGPSVIKRKSFSSFSSRINSSKNSSKPFTHRFFNELNNLYAYSHNNGSSDSQGAAAFYEKQMLLYKTAYNSFKPNIKKV